MWTWVIIGFVVLQAVVGGLAKAAEKRKKAEAAARRAGRPVPSSGLDRGDTAQKLAKLLGVEVETSEQDPAGAEEAPPRRPVAGLPGGQAPRPASLGSVSAEESARDLRRRRIEALRRRQATVGKKPPIPPPAGATPPVPPPPVPVKPSAPPNPVKASTPTPATPTAEGTPGVAAQVYRRRSREPRGGTSSDLQGSRASRLRTTMRNPRTMREAILVAELIRTPVALRPNAEPGM